MRKTNEFLKQSLKGQSKKYLDNLNLSFFKINNNKLSICITDIPIRNLNKVSPYTHLGIHNSEYCTYVGYVIVFITFAQTKLTKHVTIEVYKYLYINKFKVSKMTNVLCFFYFISIVLRIRKFIRIRIRIRIFKEFPLVLGETNK